jgi:hypothetical protein
MTGTDRDPLTTFDAEAIARVLDGRATPAERARLLAQADQSPELLALLADSSAAMSAPSSTEVVDIRARRFPRAAWMAIAAVLVAAVSIPIVWSRGGDLPPVFLSATDNPAALAAARSGAIVSTVRGGLAEDRALNSVIAGARVADYMALGADTARGTAGAEIGAALRAIPGGGVAAVRFDANEIATPDVISAAEQVVDITLFRAAAWTEMARLAAIGGDSAALERTDLRAAMAQLSSESRLTPAGRDLAGRIAAALAAPAEWRGIADLAAKLLLELRNATPAGQ